MTAEERRECVRAHRTCVFGYGSRQDGPSMTIVYYVMDGDDIFGIDDGGERKGKGSQEKSQLRRA
jgi:hypothetical protein